LGLGNYMTYITPELVGESSEWTKISVAPSYTCGINSGNLYCWGYSQYGVPLGINSEENYSIPQQIGTLNNWIDVSTSNAINNNGELYYWGTRNLLNKEFSTPQKVE